MTAHLVLCALFVAGATAIASEFKAGGVSERVEVDRNLAYEERSAACPSDARPIRAHLAFLSSRAFHLEVVDLGAGAEPAFATLADAFRGRGCVAGVNGGFFHPDWRPSGLVISEGVRLNRLESARLLSGVVYGDNRGIYVVRLGRFQDHPGIRALLQGGPYLVEGGRVVRGLSASDPNRRTFIATDWRGNWALGVTLTPLTLAELGECLALTDVLTPWRVDRALNLDGGSSSGFFFERGEGRPPVVLEPWKRVRTLLGVAPR